MPLAAILPASLAIPRSSNRPLSSCWAFTGPDLFRTFSIASSSLTAAASVATIRMGGGPRTYPGGVSKWQWKRMQAKKSNQLLKARLCRERQLYEMRKRAELKAAISELERPWETVERAPVLFSVSADEQIKGLADRFQRPSGFDMWSEKDGPRLFRTPNDLPSARFFPKGAIHSVKPYSIVAGELTNGGKEGEKVMRNDDWNARGAGGMGRGKRAMVLRDSSSLESEQSVSVEEENGAEGGNRGSYYSDSGLVYASSSKAEDEMSGPFGRDGGNHGSNGSDSVFAVDGSRMNRDDMVDFGRRGIRDRNWDSRGSNSELAVAVSRMERQETAGSFGRRGGGGGRSRFRDSYGSQSESAVTDRRGSGDRNRNSSESYPNLAVTDSRMQRHEKTGGFDLRRGREGRGRNRGSYRSYSEHEKDENEESFGKRDDRGGNRNALASGFDRRGGRGGRGGNRGSYRTYSEHEKDENEGSLGKRDDRGGNRNAMVSGFDRRGGRGGRGWNRGSYRSYSEHEKDENEGGLGKRDDRGGNRNAMVSGFDRRGGRGGRGWNRGSDRSYSEHEKDENEGGLGKLDDRGGNRNAMASGFDRRGGRGGRGWNRGSDRSYSEHEKAENEGSLRDDRGGNRTAMASDFDRRGGRGGNRGSYRSYSDLAVAGSRMERNKIAGGFGKRGGRGWNRNSYDSDSGLAITDSRIGRVKMAGGRDRDYSNGGRVSLRPTSELRLEERGDIMRELKWSGGRNDGFRVSRGRRSP